nr:hypothetical protein [Angustibacter aerolatus]
MTAPATPSDVRSERPSRFDALALALALTGAVALALTRQPGWTAVLVAACAASAVGSVRRLWLHVGLGVVGAVWLVAPVLLVVDGHTWTASEPADLGDAARHARRGRAVERRRPAAARPPPRRERRRPLVRRGRLGARPADRAGEPQGPGHARGADPRVGAPPR